MMQAACSQHLRLEAAAGRATLRSLAAEKEAMALKAEVRAAVEEMHSISKLLAEQLTKAYRLAARLEKAGSRRG